MSAFDAVEVISTKRDGGVLSDDQIDWVIAAYTRGDVAEEQMSALAMAILLNGMTRGEISRWTEAMIASMLGLTEGNRRVLLHRGRARLRQLLAEEMSRS